MILTIITPVYNEAKILPDLWKRLAGVMNTLDVSWEWLIINDCSIDESSFVIKELCLKYNNIRCISFSRNHGSHLGVLCGFHNAKGEAAILLTADLQDPPEQIPDMYNAWREGNKIVWITREKGRTDPVLKKLLANAYYSFLRKRLKITSVPESGGDMVLVDKQVIQYLKRVKEPNINILVLISWLGFKQKHLPGTREKREKGKSSFTISRQFKLFLDTVIYFSYRPLRWISYIGVISAFASLCYIIFILFNKLFFGNAAEGWSSLMIIQLFFNGLILIMIGVLGEYLWRTLEQGRERPLFLIDYTIEKGEISKYNLPQE